MNRMTSLQTLNRDIITIDHFGSFEEPCCRKESEIIDFSKGILLKDHLSPQEKASRLYREGLGYVDQEDLSSAEKAFREAADRFERIRLFWESGESVLQLLEVIEHDPKRKREAEEIRKSAIRRGLID